MKQIIKSFRLNSKGIDDISAEIQADHWKKLDRNILISK